MVRKPSRFQMATRHRRRRVLLKDLPRTVPMPRQARRSPAMAPLPVDALRGPIEAVTAPRLQLNGMLLRVAGAKAAVASMYPGLQCVQLAHRTRRCPLSLSGRPCFIQASLLFYSFPAMCRVVGAFQRPTAALEHRPRADRTALAARQKCWLRPEAMFKC